MVIYQMFQCETPRDRMTVHAMWKVEACGQAKSGWKCANQQYPACPDSRANFKAVAPYLFLFFTLAPETNSDHLMTIYMQYLHLPDYFLLHQKDPTNGPACFRKAKHILFRTVVRCLLAARTARVPHVLLPLLETKQSSLEKAACWALTNNFVVWTYFPALRNRPTQVLESCQICNNFISQQISETWRQKKPRQV